jgi:hypothetical protein
MAIDIGGTFTLAGASGAQALKFAGNVDNLKIDTAARTTYPNQIGFIAGLNADPGWVALTAAAWNIQNYFNNTSYNTGGGYSASRFTAPVAGSYLFHWMGATYKPSSAAGNYIHPMFYINGGATPTSYRMKGYFSPAGGYWILRSEIVDIFYLNVGDYVDVYVYCAAAGISLYRAYSIFSGYLVG